MTFNSAATLRHFWSNYEPEWAEWIVVDNGSTDESVEVARALGARVIDTGENLGFSRANNLGAAEACGEVLLFCNPDVTVTPKGVRRLADATAHSNVLLAPQLLNADGSNQENGRGTPYPHRKVAHMFFKRISERGQYTQVAAANKTIEVVWAMGAAIAMNRSTFEQILGWDERYFLYYEDSDICIRARRAGIGTFIDGSVRWTHGWARETSGRFSFHAWKREFRSAWLFYRSHPYCFFPLGKFGRTLAAIDRIEN